MIKQILLVSLLLMALVVTQQQVQAQTTQLKTYTDPKGFYTLQYPANWTTEHRLPISKFDKPITFFKVDNKSYEYVGIDLIPTSLTQQKFKDNFNLGVMMLNNKGENIIQSGFGIYKINGQDAGAVQVLTEQEKILRVVSVFNGKIIRVGFTTLKSDYDSQIVEVEKLIDSIKITGANRR
jgi:hypothetical protein